MKSKDLVRLVFVFLLASSIVMLLGSKAMVSTTPKGLSPFTGLYGKSDTICCGMYGGLYGMYGGLYSMYGGLYGGRSNDSVYEAYSARVKLDKLNPCLLSSNTLGGLFPPFFPI